MKENIIKKYQCETCFATYDNEEECHRCERSHVRPVAIVDTGNSFDYCIPNTWRKGDRYPQGLYVLMSDGSVRVYCLAKSLCYSLDSLEEKTGYKPKTITEDTVNGLIKQCDELRFKLGLNEDDEEYDEEETEEQDEDEEDVEEDNKGLCKIFRW